MPLLISRSPMGMRESVTRTPPFEVPKMPAVFSGGKAPRGPIRQQFPTNDEEPSTQLTRHACGERSYRTVKVTWTPMVFGQYFSQSAFV